MSGGIAITFMILAIVAAFRPDCRVAGYAVGALVLICLAACGGAFWVDARTTRATDHLVPRFGRR